MVRFIDKYKNVIKNTSTMYDDDIEIQALRKERDKYCEKYAEIQKKIDSIILEKKAAPIVNLTGKYVCIQNRDEQPVYMLIKSIDRVNSGVKLYGPMINGYGSNSSYFAIDESCVLYIEDFDCVQEISEETFVDVLKKGVSNFIDEIKK